MGTHMGSPEKVVLGSPGVIPLDVVQWRVPLEVPWRFYTGRCPVERVPCRGSYSGVPMEGSSERVPLEGIP